MNTYKKLNNLKNNLFEMNSAIIAFSGGIDSTFLLKIAKEILKKLKQNMELLVLRLENIMVK
ncbi:MAG: hypothetical protein ACOC3X_02960 [Nanoarchaeota archaeon]